jgi:hypothetical protein
MPPPRSLILHRPALLPHWPVLQLPDLSTLLPAKPVLLLPGLPVLLPHLPALVPDLPALVPDLPVLLRTRHVLLPIGRRHSRRPRISPQLPLHLPPYYALRCIPLPRRLLPASLSSSLPHPSLPSGLPHTLLHPGLPRGLLGRRLLRT